MDLQIIPHAAVSLFLASYAMSADAEGDKQDPPELRCERMGLAEGTDKYKNCLYVLSSLDKADKSLEVKSLSKCIEGVFQAAHCVVWYTRDAARDSIDEQAVQGFNAVMDSKDDVKAKVQDRCRERLGENAEELTNENMGKCIVIESAEYYEAMGETTSAYYELLNKKRNEYYNYFYEKSEKYYHDFKNWWHSSP